jgi:uncharacterized protein (TIGR00255 family)
MAVASMTGFAREAGVTGPFQWAWEIKTVNGRGLEARVRVPSGLDAIGEEARSQFLKAFARGQAQIALTVTRAAASAKVRLNRDFLQTLLSTLDELDLPSQVAPVSLDGLLAVRGVVEVDEDAADPSKDGELADALRGCLARLFDSLRATRLSEGEALATVLRRHLDAIAKFVEEAETAPARQPDAIRARLATQIAQLLDAAASLDENRLHQEAMLIAARADIREELDRLHAHVDAARKLIDGGGAIGRRLDFLAQEFGREANTLCAKANDVSLSRIGLELKAVVEQFREQVQNVE